MRLQLSFLAALISIAPAAFSQTATATAPRFAITAGYTFQRANAPAGQCGCFSLNGGYGNFTYALPHGLSGVADLSVGHTGSVNGTPQSLTTVNYLFGPRYSLHLHSPRLIPYGQVLLGAQTAISNYAAVQRNTGFAVTAGGGLNVPLTPRLSLNLVEADWLHSLVPNTSNNRQNLLRISTGITLHF